MRYFSAILFSALLLWSQGWAALTSPHRGVAATCCGCKCAQRDCCSTRPVPSSERTSAAQPLAAQRESASTQRQAKAPLEVERRLPVQIRNLPSVPSASSLVAALPLYRRHCALLI